MASSEPIATIVIPTFDHGSTIRHALASALAQTVPVEVFVIGDGVPDRCRALIRDLAAGDARIRVFDHPKHERRGEPYRHAALAEARGRIVCYLCDRDLWMPDHVERMASLLADADFAHSLSHWVLPGGGFEFFPVDLQVPEHRHRMLTRVNRVALSCAAHTLAFYRSLERGWHTTPPGKETDWHLFQQFLARTDCRCVSGTWPSAITFPSPPRLGWTEAQRVAELDDWASRLDTPDSRRAVGIGMLEAALRQRDRELGHVYRMLRDVHESRWWWLRQRLHAVAGVLGSARGRP